MGMDPVTIGLIGSGAAGLYGAISGANTQRANQRAAQDRYNQLSGMVQGQMQQGPNPYAQAIGQMFGGGFGGSGNAAGAPGGGGGGQGFQIPVSTYQPTGAQTIPNVNGFDILGQAGFNTGQDGLLQMMRKQLNPTQNPQLALGLQQQAGGVSFDNSPLFAALGQQDQFNMDQQVGALRAQARSLGQLGGTAMNQGEALLRSQLTNANATRNAQIQQGSFESAQSRALQAMGMQAGQEQAGNQFTLGAYGAQTGAASNYLQAAMQAAGIAMQPQLQGQQLGTQVNLANSAGQNAAGQFNAGQQNQMGLSQNQLILQALLGAGGLQGQQQGQNLQALGILGGMGVPQQQPSGLPGALGDLGQMAMLYPFLRQLTGGGGGSQALGNVSQIPFGVLQGLGGNLQMPTAYGFGGY